MPKFEFVSCTTSDGIIIKDLYIIKPTVYGDARGYFLETWNIEFTPYVKHLDGSPAQFVQDNESHSCKGVLRGMHFQKSQPQGKLVRVVIGTVYDAAVDLRKGSPTYGCYYGVELSGMNKLQFYIPEGFAHGFYVLSETATFVYKCTRLYEPHDEGGLIWNDPDIDIQWPLCDEPSLSEKDMNYPKLKHLDFIFDAEGNC
jgi:dTDP-4-dehydrorhamnose 3,5-epimerase